MNTSKLSELISAYLNEICDKPCSTCLCYEYCKKAKAEMEEFGFYGESCDCHGMLEGWLNS